MKSKVRVQSDRTKQKPPAQPEAYFDCYFSHWHSSYIKTAMQDTMTSAAIIAPRMIAVILVALGGIFAVSFSRAGKQKPITTKIRTSQIREMGNAI